MPPPRACGSTPCPGLCLLCTLAWAFPSSQNALTLHPCLLEPLKVEPRVYQPRKILAISVPHAERYCRRASPLMHPLHSPCCRVKGLLAFPLHSLSRPPGWVRCMRDWHSHCCRPPRVLNNVGWMELYAAGVQCISVVISGAPEENIQSPDRCLKPPFQVRLSFHFKQLTEREIRSPGNIWIIDQASWPQRSKVFCIEIYAVYLKRYTVFHTLHWEVL